jgi:hypothetical protein
MSNKKAQRAKAIQNYEQYPPRCNVCKNFAPEQKASPAIVVSGVQVAPPLQFLAAHCKVGGFAVSPHGICDLWVHKLTGETLEA